MTREEFNNAVQKLQVSLGCDIDNRFNGMTYQHFRDSLRKYKIGE